MTQTTKFYGAKAAKDWYVDMPVYSSNPSEHVKWIEAIQADAFERGQEFCNDTR